MKRLGARFLPAKDILLALFVYPSAWLLKKVRRKGIHKLPHCKNALIIIGVFPISDHYYEPQLDYRVLKQPL